MKNILVGMTVLAATASQAVIFDWENLSTGVATSFSQTVGGITATATSPGFSVTAITASGGAAGLPFGNVSLAGGVSTPLNSWKPLRIDFSTAVTSVTGWFGDNGTDNDGTVFLAAFDSSNVMISTVSVARGTTLPAQSLTVSGSGIMYVVGSTNATSNPHSIVWDNFNAVPEPGTMAALGLGVAALLRRRNRK